MQHPRLQFVAAPHAVGAHEAQIFAPEFVATFRASTCCCSSRRRCSRSSDLCLSRVRCSIQSFNLLLLVTPPPLFAKLRIFAFLQLRFVATPYAATASQTFGSSPLAFVNSTRLGRFLPSLSLLLFVCLLFFEAVNVNSRNVSLLLDVKPKEVFLCKAFLQL